MPHSCIMRRHKRRQTGKVCQRRAIDPRGDQGNVTLWSGKGHVRHRVCDRNGNGMPLTDEAEMPVAIVGAGFSGTLLAINLVRQGARVVLIERDGARLAKGLAFGTRQVEHLLNVRASNMSAYPDDPEHFQRWVGEGSGARANRFVSRVAYGHYLHEQLMTALSAAPDRFTICIGVAREAVVAPDGVEIRLDTGEVVEARALVLALGNLAPTPPPVLAGLSGDVLRADPWGPAAIEDLAPDAHVLLVGTGLTAVDVAISLDQSGFKGHITALSRRGLIPQPMPSKGRMSGPSRDRRNGVRGCCAMCAGGPERSAGGMPSMSCDRIHRPCGACMTGRGRHVF
jgi:hypothetical protein